MLISSISQHGAGVNGCQYSASKGALTAMGKNLATVLLPWRITVNSISPALIGDTTFVSFPSPLHPSIASQSMGKIDTNDWQRLESRI